jgi:hypothetical protein
MHYPTTAYRIGGVIGNTADAAAEGSISVTLVDGIVAGGEGNVPPIILGPLDSGNGAFHYAVIIGSGVSGTLKLWDINGAGLINSFDDDDSLDINDSVEANFDLAAGRYIAEIKLTNAAGKVAFLREVMEIWPGVTTDFEFAPESGDYLDPSAILANSGADLAASPILGGAAIPAGTGTGEDEANAVSYYVSAPDRANVAHGFVLESASRFADISWVANTGTAPGNTGYSANPVADFSVNYVLWVKVVSEDAATTKYYQFKIYPLPPSDGSFGDTDIRSGYIEGNIAWTAPASAAGISGYRIYFGSGPDTKLPGYQPYRINDPSQASWAVGAGAELPAGAAYFLVYYHISGEEGEYPFPQSIPILDATYNAAYGDFTVRGLDGSDGTAGVSWSDPVLSISGGHYYISGSSTSHRIQVTGDAALTLGNVTIDVNTIDGAAAFTIDPGKSATLRLVGANTLRSGSGSAGLRVPDTAELIITANSSGSLEAAGGRQGTGAWGTGAGIGGSANETGGNVAIHGGTVVATGGYQSAGIGGSGATSSGGTVTITGGTVTATGGTSGAGIGGSGCNFPQSGGNGGTVNISGGTVAAAGGINAAGIGSGEKGAGGTVNISGGVVTVKGAQNTPGIGGGGYSGEGGTVEISGNAVVFASSIWPALVAGDNATEAIAFNGKTGRMYGSVTLRLDLTVPSTYILNFLSSDQTLTIGSHTLTNEGTINKKGGTINGTVSGGGTVNN